MLLTNSVFVSHGSFLRLLRVDPAPIAVESSSGTNLNLTKPVGTAETDLLIAFASSVEVSTSFTEPSGFTQAFQGNSTQLSYKTAGGSEPSSYSVSKPDGGAKAGTILRIERAAFDTVGAMSSQSGSPTAPAITMSAPGLLLAFFRRMTGTTPNTTFTAPDGMELVLENASQYAFAIFAQQVGPGDTGTRTATPSSGTNHRGILLGVIPA